MAGDGNTVAVSLKLTGEDLEGISNSVSFTSRGSFLEACRDRKIGNSVAQKEANKLPERTPCDGFSRHPRPVQPSHRPLPLICWFILVFFFVNLWNQHVSGRGRRRKVDRSWPIKVVKWDPIAAIKRQET